MKCHVRLSRPLAHQRPILDDPHRFKVVDCGRQWGKTTMGLFMVLVGHGPHLADGTRKFKGALYGKNIWWVAPTFQIASKIWRDVKQALVKWKDLEKDEVGKRITFPGGGSLTIKSAHDPDSLRGETLDGIVVDEAAFIPEDAWHLSLRPTIAVRKGWAVLISTPKGQNFFYLEYLTGVDGSDPEYAAWKRPSSDNPALGEDELARMRAKLGPYGYQRECEAEFDVREGGLFVREWFKFFSRENGMLVPDQGAPVPEESLRVFITADLAFSSKTWADFTAVAVFGSAPDGRLFLLDMLRGRYEAPALVPMLRRVLERWGARSIWLESSGPLVNVNREARESGLPIHEYKIHTNKGQNDKVTRSQPCAVAVETGRVSILRGGPWVNEFISECCAFPDKSVHDDQVDAFALGVLVAPKPLDGAAYQRTPIKKRFPPSEPGSSIRTTY